MNLTKYTIDHLALKLAINQQNRIPIFLEIPSHY